MSETAAPDRAAPDGPLLEVRGLAKAYVTPRGPLPVLAGIDLAVASGELVAIVGASGVGKSTLLHVLGTLEAPDTGAYRLDGAEPLRLRGAELHAYRNRTIGFVFQFHHLLPEFSALENVMMPGLIRGDRRADAEHRARALLADLGLEARAEHRPAELSGGEQQRVAIGRALVNEPRLLLLDEPTGNLDSRTGEAVFELFRSLRSGRATTAIMTTHNERLSSACDRTYRMSEGVLERG